MSSLHAQALAKVRDLDARRNAAPQDDDKPDHPHAAQETTEQVLASAQAWFGRQVGLLRKAHGPSWPTHREWVLEYLREEVRQRLIARGWRPRDGR